MGVFADWLRGQYGEGRRFKSARQLSLAISDGANQSLVYDLERRESGTAETIRKLADVLEVNAVRLYLMLGWIQEDEVEAIRLTENEERLLQDYRDAPDRDKRILLAAAQAASAPDQAA